MEIKLINKSNNPIPSYATEGSSGLDLRANLEEPIILESMHRTLVPTGLYVEIPSGYEIQLRPRSGLALDSGITLLNAPGTIDSDYRGEIKVILINLSNDPQAVSHGDRIAQMIIAKVEKAVIHEVNSISESDRGEGGFGHSGNQ